MKKIFARTLFVVTSVLFFSIGHAQISVEADGAVKIGDLSKAQNVSGSSLDIAVKKIYVYTTNNGAGSFSIYNESRFEDVSVGPGTPLLRAGDMTTISDKPTYIAPLNAGKLVLGTSSKPLGSIFATTVYASGQKLTSDRRAKENIRNFVNATPYLLSLRPVRFDFNRAVVTVEEGQAENKIGFIAQEAKEILPELISYDSITSLYSMDYVSLIPVLTKGFQEQDSIIRRQQALIEAQTAMILEITERLDEMQGLLNPEMPTTSSNRAPSINGNKQSFGNVLCTNKPNPFSQETKIRYGLSKDVQSAKIVLYDVNGMQLKVYDIPAQTEGELIIRGGSLKAGIYLYGLVVDGVQVALKRMVLVE